MEEMEEIRQAYQEMQQSFILNEMGQKQLQETFNHLCDALIEEDAKK